MHEFDYTRLPAGLLTQGTMGPARRGARVQGQAGLRPLGRPRGARRPRRVRRASRPPGPRTASRGSAPPTRGCAASWRGAPSPARATRRRSPGTATCSRRSTRATTGSEPTPGVILQLHRDLYRRTPLSCGGRFKDTDNEIVGIRPDGSRYVRFRPVPAVATPDRRGAPVRRAARGALRRAGRPAARVDGVRARLHLRPPLRRRQRAHEPPADAAAALPLRVHGRQVRVGGGGDRAHEGRLLRGPRRELARLGRGGERPRPVRALHAGDGARLLPGALRPRLGAARGRRHQGRRVEEALRRSVGRVTKADLLEACPGVSRTTVERALAAMLADGKIEKVGGGRSTGYVWRG